MKSTPSTNSPLDAAPKFRRPVRNSKVNVQPTLEGIVGAISLFGATSTLILLAYIFWEIGFFPESAAASLLPTVSFLLAPLIFYVAMFGFIMFVPSIAMLFALTEDEHKMTRKFLWHCYIAFGLIWISLAFFLDFADKTRFAAIIGLSLIGVSLLVIISFFSRETTAEPKKNLDKLAIAICVLVGLGASFLSACIAVFLAANFAKVSGVKDPTVVLTVFVLIYASTSAPTLLFANWKTAPGPAFAMTGIFGLILLQLSLTHLGFSPLVAILQHYGIAHLKGDVTLSVTESRCREINNLYPGYCQFSIVEKHPLSADTAEGKDVRRSKDNKAPESTIFGTVNGDEMRSRLGDSLLIIVNRLSTDSDTQLAWTKKDGTELTRKQLEHLHALLLSIPKKDIITCTITVNSNFSSDEYSKATREYLPQKTDRPCS